MELRRTNENSKMIVACIPSKATEETVRKDWYDNGLERKYKIKEIDWRVNWARQVMYFVTEWYFNIET